MKLILALPAAGLLFSGAMSLDKMSQSPLVLPEKAATATQPKMWANSSDLYRNETLQLHFSLPHPQFLGVIDPDGHFYYVVFPAENGVGQLQPFVTSERFESLSTLKITTATFKADPYIYGILENRPVFTKSGTYRFLLGDNLHVDDESTITVLNVKYTHTDRPRTTIAVATI